MTYTTISMNEDTVSKIKNKPAELEYFIINENINNVTQLLSKLGRLGENFDYKPLLLAIKHPNKKIRTLALKNLAKAKNIQYLDLFNKIIKEDTSADVKREAVSAIGRMRDERTIPSLIKILKNKDPEIVLQAIRGLLVFKNDVNVAEKLSKLINHPNEIINKVIDIEFNEQKKINNKHTSSLDEMKNVCVHGDVIKILKEVPDESFHLTFTSPPYYNARDYSTYKSYEEYLEFLSRVFKEVHRTTKEGRFFILNTSPIIIPRVGRKYSSCRYPIPYDIHNKIVTNGWDFIDDIVWVKNEASVINRNGGFFQYRKPLTYKPNARTECLMVYRKKTNKLIDWNLKQYPKNIIEKSKVDGKYESSNVWLIDPVSDKKHSAVFPEELCKRVINYYSFIGDLVFDPFGGRGTFGKTAAILGRNYFMTEIDNNYFETMKEYLKDVNIANKNFLEIKEFITNIKKEV